MWRLTEIKLFLAVGCGGSVGIEIGKGIDWAVFWEVKFDLGRLVKLLEEI